MFFPTSTGWASSRGDDCANPAAGVSPSADFGLTLHEMGHQLGCPHAYHLDGSGEIQKITTSMVGSNGGRWFHSVNFEKAAKKVDANPCGTTVVTGNTVPAISITMTNGLTIPKGTPFALTGTATDPDPSTLTYAWQQAGFLETEASIETKNLLFAHKNPSSTGQTRTVPDYSYLLSNTDDPSANLPTVGRQLVTRFIVRDNQEPFGATAFEEFTLNVDGNSGPFVVTYPTAYLLRNAGSNMTVTWDVANTNQAPVSVSAVNVLFSSDGGTSWTLLAAQTPNDGSETITLPNTPSTQCRVKIEAVGNIFFDISNENFTLVNPATNDFAFFVLDDANAQYNEPTSTFRFNFTKLGTFTNNVAVGFTGVPAGASIPAPTQLTASGDFDVTLQNANAVSPGKYSLTITLTEQGGTGITHSLPFTFTRKGLGDGVPGNALSLTTSSQYAKATVRNLTTNTLTLSAWIKPKSRPNDPYPYSGIVFFNDYAGININTDGTLRYHFTRGSDYWGFNTRTSVEFDKWSHVALVIEPNKATMYVNGQPGRSNTVFHPVTDLGTELRVGRQENGRNFLGLIDEVRVYDKSLSAIEVQEDMHRTTNFESPNLVHYYQFNEASGVAVSPSSYENLTLTGGASRVVSTIPSGDAVVQTLPKSNTLQAYTGTGVSLKFESTTATQTGTVHKINSIPNSYSGIPPSHTLVSTGYYWEVNSYPATTNAITDATFTVNADVLPTDNATNYVLYRRAQGTDGPWALEMASFSVDPVNETMTFKNLQGTGQYLIGKSADPILNLIPVKAAFDCFLTSTNNTELLEYAVQGGNLTAPINLSLTDANFQLSTNAASGFAPSLQLTPANGAVNQAVFVKFVGSLTGQKSVTLTASSLGITSKTASFTAAVQKDAYNRTNAMSFDGTDDRVRISGLTWRPTIFTVEFWYKPNNVYDYWNHFLGKTSQFFMHSDGVKIIKVGTENTEQSTISTASETLLPGQWIHIAYTFDAGTASLYLNGKLYQSKTGVVAPEAWSNWDLGSATQSLNGELDEFRIWSVARTEQQIQENKHLINDLKAACTDGLVLYYQFDNNTGSTIEDAVGAYPGTILGNPTIVASSAPVGFGKSQSNAGTTTGVYDFSAVNASINFSSSPNGNVVVSEITGTPPVGPPATTGTMSASYWIINYYGALTNLGSPVVTLKTQPGFTSSIAPSDYQFFKRGTTAFTTGDWAASTPTTIATNAVSFTTAGFSQFVVANSAPPCALTVNIAAPSGTPAALTITQGQVVSLTASGADSYSWTGGQIGTPIGTSTLSVSTAGTYSVMGVRGACSATATITVSVTIPPVAPVALSATSPTIDQALLTLGAGNCPLQFTGQGWGKTFVLMGPVGSNYVYTNAFRNFIVGQPIMAPGIKAPGTYTLTVYGDPGQTPVSYSVLVTGTGCN